MYFFHITDLEAFNNLCKPYPIANPAPAGFLYYYGYRLQTAGSEVSDSVRVKGADNPLNSTVPPVWLGATIQV